MGNNDVAYQNKDIVSKALAESLLGKSLKVYGIDVPRIKQVLPTNLPDVEANELRIDNLFLLEDGTIALIDYESVYKKSNRNKYLNYIARVLKRYELEGILDIKIRMIIIYTGDIARKSVPETYDVGAAKLTIERAFLSELDSDEIKERLKDRISKGEELTDEEIMEFIILPLTYRKPNEKQESIKESIELAKKIKDEAVMKSVLAGMLAFTDKVMDDELRKEVKGWLMMTKIARLFEEEKEAALALKDAEIARLDADIAKRDADLAKKDADIANKDARIKELEAQILQAKLKE